MSEICPQCGTNSDYQTRCCAKLSQAKAEIESLKKEAQLPHMDEWKAMVANLAAQKAEIEELRAALGSDYHINRATPDRPVHEVNLQAILGQRDGYLEKVKSLEAEIERLRASSENATRLMNECHENERLMGVQLEQERERGRKLEEAINTVKARCQVAVDMNHVWAHSAAEIYYELEALSSPQERSEKKP